jgi:hypothetical protein
MLALQSSLDALKLAPGDSAQGDRCGVEGLLRLVVSTPPAIRPIVQARYTFGKLPLW